MANPFAAAAAKASTPAPAGGKKKEKSIIEVQVSEVAQAIDDFIEADTRFKQAKADKEVAAGKAEPFCQTTFLTTFGKDGRQPETMKFRTKAGNTVTYITQDKGEQYNASDEQIATLKALLGEEKTDQVVRRDMTFSFNSDILNKAGVMEALGAKIAELVKDAVLTEEESGLLLEATPRVTIRKGVLADLAKLCNNDPKLMEQVMGALGSHIGHYVKG